jgi:signal transduction histidine kinase/CheY-like chemotaxis protein
MARAFDKHLPSILANLHESIVVVDNDGLIRYANRAAEKMLSASAGAMADQPVEDVVQVTNIVTYETGAEHFPATHENGEWCQLKAAGGLPVPVEKWEIPLIGEEGGKQGTIICLRDNSREQDYIRKIERAKQQAEKAATAKNEFLANISHELRTPLNSILGMSELALDLVHNREQEEYLRILKLSAESLYGLITSMLDYVKLESGTFNIHDKTFQLKELTDAIVANFAINCHIKHLGFFIIIEPGDAASYIGDEIRIVQIINNLLSNALKFTQNGEIVLSIKEVRQYEANTSEKFRDARPLEISVQDTGIGIPPDRLWDIFQPFTQIDPVQNRENSGTGIGLTITKMLVEAMGGRIRVESEPGVGSTFTATVWLKTGGMRRTPEAGGIMRGTGKCILLSQSPGWIESIRSWLEHIGVPVVVCGSVPEFEQAVCGAEGQSILCFFHGSFPDVDELLELCRHPHMAAVAQRKQIVTMRIPREEEYRWQSAPFAFQLTFEPMRPVNLFGVIKELEIEHFATERVRQPGEHKSEFQLHILYAEDEALNRMAVTKTLTDAGHMVHSVADGQALVQEYHNGKYDLMVIDIFMPKMNGYEAVSLIRSEEHNQGRSRIPIIALTAHNSAQDRHHAEILGMNAFVSKPYSGQALLLVIDRVWERELRGYDPSSRGKGKSIIENLYDNIRVGVQAGYWENTQHHVQELRTRFKDANLPEAGEKSFRLLLAVRRQSVDETLKILDDLMQGTGDSNESFDSRR